MRHFTAVVATAGRILARRDFVSGMITAAAAIMMLVNVRHQTQSIIHGLFSLGGGPDNVAAVALLLNAALLLFAWTCHREARREMKARVAAEECADLLRNRDEQTELLNRRSLRERGEALIETTRIEQGSVALMVVNLNRFKKVNEVYGDAVGDGLLRILAGIILATAPRHALCARLASDEFAILSAIEEGSEDKFVRFSEELLGRLNMPVEVMGATISVSATIGMARLDDDCRDFTTLLRRSDIAMNAAKAKADGRPLWFEPHMERALRTRSEVETGLRRGIPLGEFVPYFQPIVEFSSGTVRTVEMLARWQHPGGGIVGPDVFIPVAEETGLIGALSERLIAAAMIEARSWDPGVTLAVNISPRQLADPWFPQKILKLLAETGFPAQRLELEITESSLFEDIEHAKELVASLKMQGISLCLDDFGTGYSSLAHLRALPFDRIKIDRGFVLTLNKNSESWTIVKTVANLGHSLGVPVTVEGVESAAVELRVRSLGCDAGQGWFFGHPVPAAQIRQMLAEHGLAAQGSRGFAVASGGGATIAA